jgi:hypothetical protein
MPIPRPAAACRGLFKQLDPVRFNQLGKNLLVAVLFPAFNRIVVRISASSSELA